MAQHVNPLVTWLAKAACAIFYRVESIGEVPHTGALLLLPNHPNGLLDPALICATAGREVRFLAKSTLFKGPLRPILAAAGAIPVYRQIDRGADTSRNAEMFVAVGASLAAHHAICLFPEGISHSSGRLEPLRTGAARMALAAQGDGTNVCLLPVGLNFDRKTAFRSRVTVVYGRPFSGSDLLPAREEDLPQAVRALTDRTADHMRRILIEADPEADAALVDRVDRLYAAARGRPRDPADRLARRRAIAAGIERMRETAPERYDELLLRFRRYDQRLQRFGLKDRHLDWQVGWSDAVSFAARELIAGIVLIPLCVAGLVLFVVPYQLTGIAARLSTQERDQLATAQVAAGAVIYGLWTGFLATIAWWLGGRNVAIATAVMAPILAFASLLALERESSVLDAVKSWLQLRRAHSDTRDRLRRRRSELADVLDQVHLWLTDEAQRASPAGSGS